MVENCDNVSIVSVPDFTELPIVINDKLPYIDILKSLSNIYYNKKQIEYENSFKRNY